MIKSKILTTLIMTVLAFSICTTGVASAKTSESTENIALTSNVNRTITNPQTGDNSNILIIVGVAALAGCGLFFLNKKK